MRPTRADDVRFLVVEVDVEVLGLEHLEVERLALDLVAPEILRLSGAWWRSEAESEG